MVGQKRKLILLVSALPFVYMLSQMSFSLNGMPNSLGSDPGKALTGMSGIWTLRFLLITLFVSPARDLFKLGSLPRFRRMLGLYTFFYASLHLLCYLTFMLQWRVADLAADFLERPYISMGIVAFLLLVPLAVTSNRSAMRIMGQSWKRLHRLVYLVVILALIHLAWQTRGDFGTVFLYSSLTILMLGYRLFKKLQWISKPYNSG
jgi:sulfoxide reductase heme-binding subunit YedZ